MGLGASETATGPLEPGSVSVLLQAARQANAAAYKIFFILDFVDKANPFAKIGEAFFFPLLNVFKKNCLYRENTIEIYVG